MGDYNITKIIDGLFISDQNVAFDAPFLMGNKIIRMLGWTAEPFYQNLQEQGIQQHILTKNVLQVKFPSFQELQQGFQCLQTIHQEMLCGLIYSQSQLQASLICIMYIMRRYRWDHNTAYQFLKTKLEMFQCSEQTLGELEKYQEELIHNYNTKLNRILWDYQFLVDYKPTHDEQRLLITTIKNKMRGIKEETFATGKNKKTKRIRWQDQLRPSSPFSISSSKNIGKSSLPKGRLPSPSPSTAFNNQFIQHQMASNKDLQLLYQSVNFKSSKPKTKNDQNQYEENSQYKQLKEISRTNFNDHKYMTSKLRRRTSLKPKNTVQKSNSSANIQSISALVGIYGNKKGKGLSRSSSGQSFLTGLRNFNKLSMSNA